MNSKWFQQASAVLLFPILCVWVLAGCSGTNTHKLISIAITPATASIKAGATQPFTATGTFANGSSSDITSKFPGNWTSGAVDASGAVPRGCG